MLALLAPIAVIVMQAGLAADAATPPPPANADAAQKITDKSHPDYIKCKTEPVLGSRAQRTRTCKTNREWALLAQQAKRLTNEMIGQPRVGGVN